MIFSVLLTLTAFFMSGVSGVDTEKVTLMEGDSVTLQTDVQCNEDTERFRDRLKLDHQTGSLTITNINTTDSGVYALKIISSSISEKIFSVTVLDVSAAEEDQTKRKSVKEGEAVTLDTGVIKNTDDVMVWYFNETLIAEITGDQSKICTDDECKERFRDRLKLDHQTGSLTITDTRTTDSGLYKLQINSSSIRRHRRSISITSWKTFTVTVFDVALSSAAVAGICVFVLLLVAAAAGVVYCGRRQTKWNDSRKQCSDQKTHILETANKTLPDGNVTEVANQTLM
uniref:Immunoglobulin domain-containing protein n=1 Tax=Cyprinus carpio TaxID=7962 RepID=A0A8C1TC56_CYPCA